MVKITVLIDNNPHPQNKLLDTEHGLSLYIEFDSKKILCDMGASDKYAENAQRLGIDLKEIDFATLSHGHADHTGGLGSFLKINQQATVYLSNKIFGRKFYSYRQECKRDISTDQELESMYPQRFDYVAGSQWINPKIALVYNDCNRFALPQANRFLTVADDNGETPDDFSHEIALALKSRQGLVIISSCSHGGAMNIIDSCRRFTGIDKVHAFVGGLHFVDQSRTDEEVSAFVETMTAFAPNIRICTGHCTGSIAKQQLSTQKILPEVSFFHTGVVL
ncbi:MAG: MBL fold metallo-hydrolase [Bacteroides sp.]